MRVAARAPIAHRTAHVVARHRRSSQKRPNERGITTKSTTNEDDSTSSQSNENNGLPVIEASSTLYETLNIREGASEREIRSAFLSVSKMYHPDVRRASALDGSMIRVNDAYETLIDASRRRAYDGELRKLRMKNGSKSGRRGDGVTAVTQGLVGPIVSDVMASLDVCDANECALDISENTADAIRQWAKTLAFTSELPLPLPLSVDDLPTGARLAFMRYDSSQGLREAGALTMEVREDDTGARVEVKRTFTKSSEAARGQIPGEARVMQSFIDEFSFLIADDDLPQAATNAQARNLGGFGSALAAFFLPGLPMFGATRTAPGGAYQAYKLRRDAKHIE